MNDTYRPRIDALKWLKGNRYRAFKHVAQWEDPPFNPPRVNLMSQGCCLKLLIAENIKVEVLYFENDDRQITDEIFITIPDPLSKALLIEIVALEADEFDEIEPNVFRLWWD